MRLNRVREAVLWNRLLRKVDVTDASGKMWVYLIDVCLLCTGTGVTDSSITSYGSVGGCDSTHEVFLPPPPGGFHIAQADLEPTV